MRLLIDCDGVLSHFLDAYLSVVNHVLKRNHTEEDVTEWAIERALGLTEEQQKEIHSYVASRGFATHLQPYDGSIEAMTRLRANHDVYIVTSPLHGSPTWMHDRERWLESTMGISRDRVIHTAAKHCVSGDVFIDDKPENVRNWQAAHPNGIALLWHQPYNWAPEHRGDLMVCHSWQHLFDILELLGRETVPTGGVQ